jgi:hypothetical protein
MYQCQMGKQTMGVPVQSRFRADNKLYCLNSGQTPIVRTRAYHEYGVDNFPTGNNAIVCVISYTASCRRPGGPLCSKGLGASRCVWPGIRHGRRLHPQQGLLGAGLYACPGGHHQGH